MGYQRMKMGKQKILSTIILILIVALSTNVLANTARLTDTEIDYIPYREVVVGDQGIAYQMRITNLGDDTRTYYVLPDVESVKALGTYKLNPTDMFMLEAGQSQEVYFYLALEKGLTHRITIPVEITTGDSSITIELVARTIGPLKSEDKSILIEFFKTILTAIIIILIIIAIISVVKKSQQKKQNRKLKNNKKDFDENDVETYY